jgi:8-oxo-dGTP pyrophosphatase MutT (NUDIX family)
VSEPPVTGDVGRPDRPERRRAEVVPPKPAATVVLLRPGRHGPAVLLTRRPKTMRFGGDLYVFPGGRLDEEDADHRAAAVRETHEETGIELDAVDLIPLGRWVTPTGLSSRYDARFFAAFVPPGTDVVSPSDEVVDWRWLPPAEALAAVAEGDLAMWQPTIVTLQQLDGLVDRGAIEAAFSPGQGSADPSFREIDVGLIRVEQPWAAGIEGRVQRGWIVGRREWVVVDPADPTGLTTDAIVAEASRGAARVVAVAITDLDPVHHAGVESFAAGLALPVVGGPGAARLAPYPLLELAEGQHVPFGDMTIVVRDPARGPAVAGMRPETVQYAGLGWLLPEDEPA